MLKSARPYLIAIGVFWFAPLALAMVLHFVLPRTNADGTCVGLGFGCALPPSDGILLWWAFTLPFTFTAGLIALGVVALTRRGRRKRAANLAAGRPFG